jgi:hypothetical protein
MGKDDANNNDQALSDKERAGLDVVLTAGRYFGSKDNPNNQAKGK